LGREPRTVSDGNLATLGGREQVVKEEEKISMEMDENCNFDTFYNSIGLVGAY
jgi:hypothetical protein